jgi:hypothetical protein
MTGPLLRTGNLKSFHPLGAVGNPVYLAAPQLRVAISRRLGARIADSFAVPQRNEDGDTIDWYAPNPGPVVPWSAASPEERAQAREQLLEVRTRVQELAAQMQQETGSERQVFGRLLEQVNTFPDDEHIYLVNGHPVITFWGFHHSEGVVGDPLLDLELAPDQPPPPAKGRGLPWWLWLLLLLLLFGLGLFLLRACQPPPPPPELTAPTTSDQPSDPALSGDDNTPEEEPITELTAGNPAWEEQAASETDQEYAERMRTRVRRGYSRQESYSNTDRTRATGTETVDGEQTRVETIDEATTPGEERGEEGEASNDDLEPGEIVVGEDGEIEAVGADPEDLNSDQEPPINEPPATDELPDDAALPDSPAMDEPPMGEPVDPNAQSPEEAPPEELPAEPPLEDPMSSEEPPGEPVDPNAQGPDPDEPPIPESDQPPEPEAEPEQPQVPEDPAQPPVGEKPPPPSSEPPQTPEAQPGSPADGQNPTPDEQPAPPGQAGATPKAPDTGNRTGSTSQNSGQNPSRRPGRHRYSSGNWRPSISLQDPRNGLPLKIEYDMTDGRGKVKLRRHDGSVCTGDAGSAIRGGKAIINATSNIRCPDGTNFGRPSLECPPGSQGSKGCVLRYSPSGPGVPVGAMKPAP